MYHLLLVALGGSLGAVARYTIDQLAITYLNSSLAGTFIVNISGSFVLGLLLGITSANNIWPEGPKLFLSVGFLGSYTTFSTLSVATIHSAQKGDIYTAIINMGVSIVVGLSAALLGILLGKSM